MDTKQDRTAIVALIAGGVALLLGLCMGALGGGVAGYLIGRQVEGRAASNDVAPGLLPELPSLPSTPQSPTLPRLPITPELPELPALPDLPRGLLGVTGALVREVIAGSPAERAGLQLMDVITGVDDIPLDADHPLMDVLATFRPGDRVELQVWRAGETLTLNVTLGEHPDNAAQPYLGIRYVDMQMQQRRQSPQD